MIDTLLVVLHYAKPSGSCRAVFFVCVVPAFFFEYATTSRAGSPWGKAGRFLSLKTLECGLSGVKKPLSRPIMRAVNISEVVLDLGLFGRFSRFHV